MRRHERMFDMFNTLVFGAEKLTRAVLPHYRERRSGTLVFNGSMWVGEGVTGNSVYCGAKFALEGRYKISRMGTLNDVFSYYYVLKPHQRLTADQVSWSHSPVKSNPSA
jgi:hypothetical protein